MSERLTEELETFDANLYIGDEQWHGGAGFYWTYSEYEDEGSVGPYTTKEEAIASAEEEGGRVVNPDKPYRHRSNRALGPSSAVGGDEK